MWLLSTGLNAHYLCCIAPSGSLPSLQGWQVWSPGREPILSAPKPALHHHTSLLSCSPRSVCAPSEPRQVIGSCLPVHRGLPSCPAPPGPSFRSHLCCSTDNSVCPSKARAIKGSIKDSPILEAFHLRCKRSWVLAGDSMIERHRLQVPFVALLIEKQLSRKQRR